MCQARNTLHTWLITSAGATVIPILRMRSPSSLSTVSQLVTREARTCTQAVWFQGQCPYLPRLPASPVSVVYLEHLVHRNCGYG